jgi:hypothetical protein
MRPDFKQAYISRYRHLLWSYHCWSWHFD